jgi:hypothetical protein
MAKAVETLRHARSVHYEETQSDGTNVNRFESDLTADASASHASSTNGAWEETVSVGGRFYDRGSFTGGHWWILPSNARQAANASTINQVTNCMKGGSHGHLTAVGSLTGSKVVLADDGNSPGDAPARLYLTVGRQVRLDRVVSYGPGRPGGRPNCGGIPRAGATIDGSFSAYGAPVTVTAPAGAVPAPSGTT